MDQLLRLLFSFLSIFHWTSPSRKGQSLHRSHAGDFSGRRNYCVIWEELLWRWQRILRMPHLREAKEGKICCIGTLAWKGRLPPKMFLAKFQFKGTLIRDLSEMIMGFQSQLKVSQILEKCSWIIVKIYSRVSLLQLWLDKETNQSSTPFVP